MDSGSNQGFSPCSQMMFLLNILNISYQPQKWKNHHRMTQSRLELPRPRGSNSTMISISDNSIPPTIQISTPDPPNLVLGLQGMLDEAGPVANTPESQNVFVC